MAAAETILLPDCCFCPDKSLNLSTLSSGLTPQVTCYMTEFLIIGCLVTQREFLCLNSNHSAP